MATELPNNEPQKWDKLPDESTRAYSAFCLYRDAGVKRSMFIAYNAYKGDPEGKKPMQGNFRVWTTTYRWRERAEAYDAYMERANRREAEDAQRESHQGELKGYRRRQLQLAQATQKTAILGLNLINAKLKDLQAKDIPLRSLPSYIRAFGAVAETSSNAEAQALAVEELLKVIDGSDPNGSETDL